ncbi:MAG: cobalamin-dependent protein [Chloroflexi bacterium]|nr:cobalamin-dependent protein [Chloroflexota bacterium]
MSSTPWVAGPEHAGLYNTAAVVQRTGVRATTIRAWERRYGYPMPRREAGGQRLYSERDIDGIRWLRDQTTHGVAISRAIAMLRSGYAGPPSSTSAPAVTAPRSFASLRSEMLNALLELNPARAEAVLQEAFALFSVEEVCLQLFEPLLIEVGDRWHAGELSIAAEHYITSFIRSRLFALLNAYQRPDLDGPVVFTACAPDEWHEIGIVLVSIFLARRGIAVRYLGPNLPLDALAELVAQQHPSVVALSAQSRDTARALRGVSEMLSQGAPPHPRVVFGGHAFNRDAALRESIEGTYVGPNAVAAADAIAAAVAQTNGRSRRRSAKRPS